MFKYLKYNTDNTIISFDTELSVNDYEIGETYNDYINGKWVKLTEEQINFYEKNQKASPKEIIEMKLEPINIDDIKRNKLTEIDKYDKSDNVNSFKLNGVDVWVDRETRVSLMSTTKIKKEMGINDTTIWFGNFHVNIKCDDLIQMLSVLELYAYNCFNKTAEHKSNINLMDNAEDIKNYDITDGYPEKLVFNI